MIKIRAEINEIRNNNKSRSLFFEINKSNKFLFRLIRGKKRKDTDHQYAEQER